MPPPPPRRPTEPDIVVIREGDSKPVEKTVCGLPLRASALDALEDETWRYRHALSLLANELAEREGSPRVYSGHIRQAAEQLRCIPAEPARGLDVDAGEWTSDDAKGKVIEKLEFVDGDPCGSYWVVSFTDGSEMCVHFMAEVVERQQSAAEARTRVAES